jgi:hypothetical protein
VCVRIQLSVATDEATQSLRKPRMGVQVAVRAPAIRELQLSAASSGAGEPVLLADAKRLLLFCRWERFK